MDAEELYKLILTNPYGSVFITDKEGTITFVNIAAEKLLGRTLKNLVGCNVKDFLSSGYYDNSTVLECIRKKTVVVGTLRTQAGTEIMAVSSPIMDEHGEIVVTVTNSLDKSIVETFIKILNREKKKARQYKNTVDYLVGINDSSKEIIAKSPKMKKLLQEAYAIAKADCSVLVLGESGVGKEVLVNYIHQNSNRSGEALIPVNCAAIPKDLMESEFFGYEKGAFTGANEKGKPGLFELANRGTIFLDEIAELSLELQAKLLRVIETRKVQRLGSVVSKDIDFRLIAATNRDLHQMSEDGTFRSNLYYRLNVVPLYIRPLRERPEDIVALTDMFLKKFNQKHGKQKELTEGELRLFQQYPWPGNIRELQNIIERIVITDANARGVLSIEVPKQVSDLEKYITQNFSLKEYSERMEWLYIQHVLKECDGKVSEAAQKLGIHRTALYKKINAYEGRY